MKNKGKVKSISVKKVTEGIQVLFNDFVYKVNRVRMNKGLDRTHDLFDMIPLDDKGAKFISVKIQHFVKDALKTLVVEYVDQDVVDSLKPESMFKQLPLKYSQWQSAIDNGEVDSDKEVEFEFLYRVTKDDILDSNNLALEIAKIIPQKKRVYSEEDIEKAWDAGFKRGQVIGSEIDYNLIDVTPTKGEYLKNILNN